VVWWPGEDREDWEATFLELLEENGRRVYISSWDGGMCSNGVECIHEFLGHYWAGKSLEEFRYARSVEDFLAKANASYDKFLQEEKQRNPGFDDAEARLHSSLMQQMARNIWFEELLRE
jgi:hypothetical protein